MRKQISREYMLNGLYLVFQAASPACTELETIVLDWLGKRLVASMLATISIFARYFWFHTFIEKYRQSNRTAE